VAFVTIICNGRSATLGVDAEEDASDADVRKTGEATARSTD